MVTTKSLPASTRTSQRLMEALAAEKVAVEALGHVLKTLGGNRTAIKNSTDHLRSTRDDVDVCLAVLADDWAEAEVVTVENHGGWPPSCHGNWDGVITVKVRP